MNPDHQNITLALHLGAFVRKGKFPTMYDKGLVDCQVITFVPPTSPAPFTYGMTRCEPYNVTHHPVTGPDDTIITHIAADIPRYDQSLDALTKAESGLDYAQQKKQTVELYQIIDEQLSSTEVTWSAVITNQVEITNELLRATPAQRLIALLRTLNLYRNDT